VGARAEGLRIGYLHSELSRDGPGLMLRDIEARVPQVVALLAVIEATGADVLVLGDVDYDAGSVALGALNAGLARPYPYVLALPGNAGIDTGLDLDGDGRLGGPRDMQSYGRFAGQGGLGLLSRLPILTEDVVSLNDLLWRDLPGSLLVDMQGREGRDALGAGVQRLSSGGHWIVPLRLASGGRLTLLAFHASAPVFDGPEDRNGRRNHDEIALWRRLLDGALPVPPPAPPLVLLGTANVDPEDGEGRAEAIRGLLGDPRLQDPRPVSAGGAGASTGPRTGDPALHSVDWNEPGPGNLRVDYILPSAGLRVSLAGIVWPRPGEALSAEAVEASRHRLVWVNILP